MSDSSQAIGSDHQATAARRPFLRLLAGCLALVAFQFSCLAIATDPMLEHLDDRLVGASLEPLHQLWLMDRASASFDSGSAALLPNFSPPSKQPA